MKRPILRAVTVLLATGLIAQDIAWALPEGALPSPVLRPSALRISPEFASVEGTHHAGPFAPLVIHIQDAHSNLGAQKNIAKVLEELLPRQRIDTVFVEGGTKDDSLHFLRPLAPARIRERVANEYLMKGEISGAEYLNIASDIDMRLLGVEDGELYERNLRAYAQVARGREGSLAFLSEIEKRIDTLKARLYPPHAASFDRLLSEFRSGDKGLEEYHARIFQAASEAGVNWLGYPEFSRLSEIKGQEKEVDFESANAGDPAALARYQAYAKRARSLDMPKLLEEMALLQEEVFRRALRGADGLRLYEIDRWARNRRLLFSLQASKADVDEYRRSQDDPGLHTLAVLAFLNRRLMDAGLDAQVLPYRKVMEDPQAHIEDFYALAQARDEVFVRRTLDRMGRDNIKTAVLITGGYHSENLKKLLRQHGASYAVVSPVVGQESNLKRYERILLAHSSEDGPAAGNAGQLSYRAVAERPLAQVLRTRLIEEAVSADRVSGARLAEADADDAFRKVWGHPLGRFMEEAESVRAFMERKMDTESVVRRTGYQVPFYRQYMMLLSMFQRLSRTIIEGQHQLRREMGLVPSEQLESEAAVTRLLNALTWESHEKLSERLAKVRAADPHTYWSDLEWITEKLHAELSIAANRVYGAPISEPMRSLLFDLLFERAHLTFETPGAQTRVDMTVAAQTLSILWDRYSDKIIPFLHAIGLESQDPTARSMAQDVIVGRMFGEVYVTPMTEPHRTGGARLAGSAPRVDLTALAGPQSKPAKVKAKLVYDHQFSALAAKEIADEMVRLQKDPDYVVNTIFATGGTMEPIYAELVNDPRIDWSRVRAFHLDEYAGLPKDHLASYASYLERHLFSKLPVRPEVHFIDGADPDMDYAAKISKSGGADIVLLGLGENGHIAGLEPDTFDFEGEGLQKIQLHPSTVQANIVFNPGLQDPANRYWYTLGVKDIMTARKVFLMTKGKNKAIAVRDAFGTVRNKKVSASIVQEHPDFLAIVDRAAALEWDGKFAFGARLALDAVHGRRPRMLILDDRPLRIKKMSDYYSRRYDVDTATTFEEALDLVREGRYDVLMSDLDLSSTVWDKFKKVRIHDGEDHLLKTNFTRRTGGMHFIKMLADMEGGPGKIVLYSSIFNKKGWDRFWATLTFSAPSWIRRSVARPGVETRGWDSIEEEMNKGIEVGRANRETIKGSRRVVPKFRVNEIRQDVFRHDDGIGIASTIDVLRREGALDLMQKKGSWTMGDLVDHFLFQNEQAHANRGYLHGAMQGLAKQGFVTIEGDPATDERRFTLTPEGRVMIELAPAYAPFVEFIPTAAKMEEFLFSRPRDPPQTRDAKGEQFARLITLVRRGSDLPVEIDPMRAKVRQQVLRHTEGLLLGPLLVQLRWQLDKGRMDMSRPLRIADIEGNEANLALALDLLEERGWIRRDEADPGQFTFTASGLAVLSYAWSYGVPVSYLPTFDPAVLQTLFFGSPSSVADLFRARGPRGEELLVNRAMNVVASGEAHEVYFMDMEAEIIKIFDDPNLHGQPIGAADMGSGDGAFLAFVARTVKEKTLRGKHLDRYPLLLFGGDFSKESNFATSQKLSELGIPRAIDSAAYSNKAQYHSDLQRLKSQIRKGTTVHQVLFGDVTDPAAFGESLDRQLEELQRSTGIFPGRKLTAADFLHIRSFLDHNRPFKEVRDKERARTRQTESKAVAAWRGRALTNGEIEQNLYEHLSDWKQLIWKHGLLMVELFTTDSAIAAANIGETLDTGYFMSHILSDQILVELPVQERVAEEAGLKLKGKKYYHPNKDLVTVARMHFVGAEREGQGARLAADGTHYFHGDESILRANLELLGKKIPSPIHFDRTLENLTTIEAAESAVAYVEPTSLEELQAILRFTYKNNINVYFLGRGSNALIAGRLHGLVVSTVLLDEVTFGEDGRVAVETGTSLIKLSRLAMEQGLSGLEFAINIPGTVGGAVFTAAGYPVSSHRAALEEAGVDVTAFNSLIGDVVESVEALKPDGSMVRLSHDEMEFGYRTSIFQGRQFYVHRVHFKLQKKTRAEVHQLMGLVRKARRAQRDRAYEGSDERIFTRSLGRSFKNDDPSYGGLRSEAMIREAGADAFFEGGMRQVPGRPGVIYNAGNGSTSDYMKLTDRIEDAVFEKFGVHLVKQITVLPHRPEGVRLAAGPDPAKRYDFEFEVPFSGRMINITTPIQDWFAWSPAETPEATKRIALFLEALGYGELDLESLSLSMVMLRDPANEALVPQGLYIGDERTKKGLVIDFSGGRTDFRDITRRLVSVDDVPFQFDQRKDRYPVEMDFELRSKSLVFRHPTPETLLTSEAVRKLSEKYVSLEFEDARGRAHRKKGILLSAREVPAPFGHYELLDVVLETNPLRKDGRKFFRLSTGGVRRLEPGIDGVLSRVVVQGQESPVPAEWKNNAADATVGARLAEMDWYKQMLLIADHLRIPEGNELRRVGQVEMVLYRWRGEYVRYGMRRGLTQQDAEDLAQEVFTKILKKAHQFQGKNEAAFKTWAHRVLITMTINKSRYQHRHPSGEPLGDIERPSNDHRPDVLYERREIRQAVREALKELSPEHRMVLVLDMLGYRYKEIAAMIKAPVTTVKSRLTHAKHGLKDIILRDRKERRNAVEDARVSQGEARKGVRLAAVTEVIDDLDRDQVVMLKRIVFDDDRGPYSRAEATVAGELYEAFDGRQLPPLFAPGSPARARLIERIQAEDIKFDGARLAESGKRRTVAGITDPFERDGMAMFGSLLTYASQIEEFLVVREFPEAKPLAIAAIHSIVGYMKEDYVAFHGRFAAGLAARDNARFRGIEDAVGNSFAKLDIALIEGHEDLDLLSEKLPSFVKVISDAQAEFSSGARLAKSTDPIPSMAARLASALDLRGQVVQVPVSIDDLIALFTLTHAHAGQVRVTAERIKDPRILSGEALYEGIEDPRARGGARAAASTASREPLLVEKTSDARLKGFIDARPNASIPAAMEIPLSLFADITDPVYFRAQFMDFVRGIVQYRQELGKNDVFFLTDSTALGVVHRQIVEDILTSYPFIRAGWAPSSEKAVVRFLDLRHSTGYVPGRLQFAVERVGENDLMGWFGQIYIAMAVTKHFSSQGRLDISSINGGTIPEEFAQAYGHRAGRHISRSTFARLITGRLGRKAALRYSFKRITTVPIEHLLSVFEAAQRSILGSA